MGLVYIVALRAWLLIGWYTKQQKAPRVSAGAVGGKAPLTRPILGEVRG